MSKRVAKLLLPSIAAASLAMAALPDNRAEAQSTSQAEVLNKRGKALFKERRYLEAYRAFKQAIESSPEGRYYFNLCFSLNYLERFQEAIDACELVESNGADAKLMKKTNAVLGALRAKVPAPAPPPNGGDPNGGDPNGGDPNGGDPNGGDPNGGDPNGGDPNGGDPNGGDPNAGDPNGGDPNAGDPNGGNVSTGPATVPGFDPFAEKAPANDYEWSMGGSVAPLSNLGVGSSDTGPDAYGSGGRLNLFANFMFSKALRIGAQGYLGFATLGEGDISGSGALTQFDVGGALYKHVALAPNLDLTPLLGLHFAGMQPDTDSTDVFATFGVRAQLAVEYALGKSKEHVVCIAPALNFYGPSGDTTDLDAMDFGLDTGGATLEFAIGYQYRFTTPFGSSPLFTLE